MKKILLFLGMFVMLLSSIEVKAANGDTVKVQAFTYGSKQDSVFMFPPDTFSCSKVLMYYKLKCPTGGCGEWDYLTYSYLYIPTGKIDSYRVDQPSFLVDGNQYDTFRLMKDTSWRYSYNSKSKSHTDSAKNNPVTIVFYRNTSKPWLPTDTLIAWPAFSRVVYDSIGKIKSKTPVPPDSAIRRTYTTYYVKYPDNLRYELGRYITPYGNGLSLGNGFTWVFDVTDYRHLLHDSVHLNAGNWQELLDMSFAFVKGTPVRDVKKVENLWNGNPAYGTANSIETFLRPLKVKMDDQGKNWRIKMRTTGHGFGGTDNCSEFCPRLHSIDVDGTKRFADTMFRWNCDLNPVYPQGGTWVYSRANWCPGAEVRTYDYELTPYVKAGDSVTLDYNVQPYKWNGVGTTPYYAIETQLVTYGAPNFTTNVAMEDILTPSNKDIYKRMNPVCSAPKILIRNNGTDPLTSVDISYGVEGTTMYSYHWTGNLKFLDTARVILPEMNWGGTSNSFKVVLSNPNGKTDEYPVDNTMGSYFSLPTQLPTQFIIIFHTNDSCRQNKFDLKDGWGNIIFSRSKFQPNTTYRDTVNLKDGCYNLTLSDDWGDGLDWWAAPWQGSGFFDLKKVKGGYIKQFNPDFGAQVNFQFTVGSFANGIEDADANNISMVVYPNPNEGNFKIGLNLPNTEKVRISVLDPMGREIITKNEALDAGDISLELQNAAKGWYVVKVKCDEGIFCRKVLVR